MPTRVSARVSAISESATLAVDAKAKALKAAGRPVIGFGVGAPQALDCASILPTRRARNGAWRARARGMSVVVLQAA